MLLDFFARLLVLLLCRFAFDSALLCLLIQRRQLALLAQDSQKLDDEGEIVVLATDVLDL